MHDQQNPRISTSNSEAWFPRRRPSEVSPSQESPSWSRSTDWPNDYQHSVHKDRSIFKRRKWEDGQEADWWFAGTGIPLIAAAIGPLANVLSIAALVTSWRMCLVDDVDATICDWDGNQEILLGDLDGHPFSDPRWYVVQLYRSALQYLKSYLRCYWLNAVSLIMGFIGNLFLLFNFTGRVRYIVALPLTIIMWYIATGIVCFFPPRS